MGSLLNLHFSDLKGWMRDPSFAFFYCYELSSSDECPHAVQGVAQKLCCLVRWNEPKSALFLDQSRKDFVKAIYQGFRYYFLEQPAVEFLHGSSKEKDLENCSRLL
ncbi:hypothetical protein [Candidatus Methylacidiphilum infernorum]|uniref:hypothetical protein n=1 Tax=Candidatus Methylacidiphilum infernorum TaxID=511746 RepID=UPI00164F6F2E|nr:hypothetical protein [Candidatus Methylacidiphilum infernorum]